MEAIIRVIRRGTAIESLRTCSNVRTFATGWLGATSDGLGQLTSHRKRAGGGAYDQARDAIWELFEW